MPETLDGTYEQTLQGIDKQKRDYAYRLLQCLVISKRPLRVEELAELFAIRPNKETIPTFDASLRPENPEVFVLSACSTLVAVVNDNGQKVVQFSHFSVREYLTSDRIVTSKYVSRFHIPLQPAHALLATACLCILLQRVDMENIRNSPLALYAAQYWVDHAQSASGDVSSNNDIQQGMERLFKSKSHFAAWLRLYNIDNSSEPYAGPLYYAALCGFRDIAELVAVAHPQEVNARGGKHVTPLHAAVDKGHLGVAKLLVERGADMGCRDSQSQTPLHVASYRGHTEVVSLLIYHGADLNAEGFNQETSLYLALKEGRRDIAKLLLEHRADINRPEIRGLTALHYALLHGHSDIVQFLLDHGADTNRRDNRSLTPLHHASMEGLNDIVQLLLDHGADVNLPGNRGLTALHHASLRGLNDIVRLLLDRGADTNRRDNRGRTALHHASLRGLNDIVKLLLDHSTVASRSEKSCWLHCIFHRSNSSIIT